MKDDWRWICICYLWFIDNYWASWQFFFFILLRFFLGRLQKHDNLILIWLKKLVCQVPEKPAHFIYFYYSFILIFVIVQFVAELNSVLIVFFICVAIWQYDFLLRFAACFHNQVWVNWWCMKHLFHIILIVV